MAKTKTNKPIKNQNDAELRVSTDANQSPTPLAYDDVVELNTVKYKYPEQFESVDDQHSRIPGWDASTKGAPAHTSTDGIGMQGSQIAMSRDIASLGGPTKGYAYADMFGTEEMYRKHPESKGYSHNNEYSKAISTGSRGASNPAANITPGHVATASTSSYNKADRN